MPKVIFILCSVAFGLAATAADPTATHYSFTPSVRLGHALYPVPRPGSRAIPDSLTPVFVNHMSRHGARFLSSANTRQLSLAILAGPTASTPSLRPAANCKKLLVNTIVRNTAGRWGALDSLGMAEQRGIASRLHILVPSLFIDTKVNAISSYVPRCVASMDEFTHQLTRLNNRVEIYSASGRQNSPLVRPWTHDKDYKEYIDSKQWHEVYDSFVDATTPISVAKKFSATNTPSLRARLRTFRLQYIKWWLDVRRWRFRPMPRNI